MGLQVPDGWEPLDREQLIASLQASARDIAQANMERTTGIVAGANLEELLGEALRNYMVEATESDKLLRGRLRDFGSRIGLAFSLGLVGRDEFADLNAIKDIRNVFAHRRQCRFADPQVGQLCAKLRIPKQRPDLFGGFSPYETFNAVVLILSENLSERARQAKKVKRQVPSEIAPKTWEGFWW